MIRTRDLCAPKILKSFPLGVKKPLFTALLKISMTRWGEIIKKNNTNIRKNLRKENCEIRKLDFFGEMEALLIVDSKVLDDRMKVITVQAVEIDNLDEENENLKMQI